MTPQEEQLIVELHSRWGNRWSRIARRLPGRTDNEIKNYWRTHKRKKAQERQNSLLSPSSTSSSSSSSLNSIPMPDAQNKCLEQINPVSSISTPGFDEEEGEFEGYSMDQIWNELAISDIPWMNFEGGKEKMNEVETPEMASPLWDYSESLWKVDGEDLKLVSPMASLMIPNCKYGN